MKNALKRLQQSKNYAESNINSIDADIENLKSVIVAGRLDADSLMGYADHMRKLEFNREQYLQQYVSNDVAIHLIKADPS